MDRAIGTLRKHLAAQGLRQDTLLFYCGDNGTSADASLASPHRGVKGQVYEGGMLVPGLIEWPARISQPRSTSVRASTSDLLPTLCSIVGQPLPDRPLDGLDLTPLLDEKMTERSKPLFFWEYNIARFTEVERVPYIDPELQKGTTPLVKLQGGKATRDFTNYRQPAITEADYLGPRAIVDGRFKLVIHEPELERSHNRAVRSRSRSGGNNQPGRATARSKQEPSSPAPRVAAIRAPEPHRRGLREVILPIGRPFHVARSHDFRPAD